MILYVNYQIATKLPRQYVTPCTWVFNLFLLFANELAHGFRFADMEAIFSPWFLQSQGSEKGQVLGWGARLDSYGGLLPRWEILFKVSVLRLISFNLDYVQSLDGRPSENIEVS